MQAKENLGNVGTVKVDNFVDQQKFSSIDKFQLKVFDHILVICHLEYTKAVEKEIQSENPGCTGSVANGGNWIIWKNNFMSRNILNVQGILNNLCQL